MTMDEIDALSHEDLFDAAHCHMGVHAWLFCWPECQELLCLPECQNTLALQLLIRYKISLKWRPAGHCWELSAQLWPGPGGTQVRSLVEEARIPDQIMRLALWAATQAPSVPYKESRDGHIP